MAQFQFTRPDAFPPLVKNLIIINVLVFVAQLVFSEQNLTQKLALYPIIPENPYIESLFRPYQIATHMFTHSPTLIFHIVFNMFGLWMFGRVLENVWGPKRFLLFYFLCGIGAAALHLAIQYFQAAETLQAVTNGTGGIEEFYYDAMGSAVGASGAIMGVFVAFGYLFPNTPLFLMFIPIPVKAKYAMIGLVAIDIFGGVANTPGDNVAHFAHLGGALTGFILVLIWNKTNRRRFY